MKTIPETAVLPSKSAKRVFLRFSSRGYPKEKIRGLTKFNCVTNLLSCFSDWDFYCIADNCDEVALEFLYKTFEHCRVKQTNLGNPGSFWACYQWAMDLSLPGDLIYFCEDDYIHTELASSRILEGLRYFDYVTLYDHPDKYSAFDGPLNPYAKRRTFSEPTEVHEVNGRYWRITNSTTMTFAIKGSVLFKDSDIWRLSETSPRDMDFSVFCALTRQPLLRRSSCLRDIPLRIKTLVHCPKRYLGVCIPGEAFHTEVAYLRESDQSRLKAIIQGADF